MYKVTWKGPRGALEMAATLLGEAYEDAVNAVGLQRLDAPMAEDDAGLWSLEAYFSNTPDLAAYEAAFRAFDPACTEIAPGETEELADDIDWVAHSLEGLGLVRAGRFILYGIHDADKLPDDNDTIPIRIDANQAFGTGHHPTTAGCLTLLDRFAGLAPRAIFDLGCGSAVLSIAAAKLWGRDVLASDIDAPSVAIAAENAALNGCADTVHVVAADGFDHAEIAARAPFDFVFANILAGPLVDFAPAMADHVARNGRVMLAGLMAQQEPGVVAAYEKAGFRLINRLDDAVWPVLLFVRTGAPATH